MRPQTAHLAPTADHTSVQRWLSDNAAMTSVPAGLAQQLREDLAAAAGEVEQAIRTHVPEYGQRGGTLLVGVVEALTFFVDHVADPRGPRDAIAAKYYELGWNTALAGSSLETLQSALRVGGLEAWRQLGRTVEKLALLLAYVAGRNANGARHDGEFADVGATVNAWLRRSASSTPAVHLITRLRMPRG